MSTKNIKEAKPPFQFEAYSHIITPLSQEDGGGFMFTMPDFPGLIADGETIEEAIEDGRSAFVAVVSAMVDCAQEIPAPSFKGSDVSVSDASGKFLMRVPRTIHSRLAARATAEGVSLNTLALAFIAEGLGRKT